MIFLMFFRILFFCRILRHFPLQLQGRLVLIEDPLGFHVLDMACLEFHIINRPYDQLKKI